MCGFLLMAQQSDRKGKNNKQSYSSMAEQQLDFTPKKRPPNIMGVNKPCSNLFIKI
jgi:hypothetical protein